MACNVCAALSGDARLFNDDSGEEEMARAEQPRDETQRSGLIK